MYYLNFATITQLLKEFRRSGVLQATLPKGIVNTQEACEIQLKLLQGEIVDCQIVTSSGRAIFVDQKVLHQVEEAGPQEWTFSLQKGATSPLQKISNHPDPSSTPSISAGVFPGKNQSPTPPPTLISPSASSPSSHPFSSLLALIPHRQTTMPQIALPALTRQQRRVLALVDDKRNIGQITALLFSSSYSENRAREVFLLLQDLEVEGVITL